VSGTLGVADGRQKALVIDLNQGAEELMQVGNEAADCFPSLISW
jgi:hypothetical protein